MVFDCSTLQHILDMYSAICAGHNMMRSIMNQTDQAGEDHALHSSQLPGLWQIDIIIGGTY